MTPSPAKKKKEIHQKQKNALLPFPPYSFVITKRISSYMIWLYYSAACDRSPGAKSFTNGLRLLPIQ